MKYWIWYYEKNGKGGFNEVDNRRCVVCDAPLDKEKDRDNWKGTSFLADHCNRSYFYWWHKTCEKDPKEMQRIESEIIDWVVEEELLEQVTQKSNPL